MEKQNNINPKQGSHSDENEPWTPEYQKPALKEDSFNDSKGSSNTLNDPTLNKISFPSYINQWEEKDPDKKDDDDDDDDDSNNEVFEEDGDFEEKDNDYRDERERYNFNHFTLREFF